jgi:hypothetical protein
MPCSYYKDEMQRAALEKLNQKRKWYQQQMETERLANKNLASKGRPLQVGTGGACGSLGHVLGVLQFSITEFSDRPPSLGVPGADVQLPACSGQPGCMVVACMYRVPVMWP